MHGLHKHLYSLNPKPYTLSSHALQPVSHMCRLLLAVFAACSVSSQSIPYRHRIMLHTWRDTHVEFVLLISCRPMPFGFTHLLQQWLLYC